MFGIGTSTVTVVADGIVAVQLVDDPDTVESVPECTQGPCDRSAFLREQGALRCDAAGSGGPQLRLTILPLASPLSTVPVDEGHSHRPTCELVGEIVMLPALTVTSSSAMQPFAHVSASHAAGETELSARRAAPAVVDKASSTQVWRARILLHFRSPEHNHVASGGGRRLGVPTVTGRNRVSVAGPPRLDVCFRLSPAKEQHAMWSTDFFCWAEYSCTFSSLTCYPNIPSETRKPGCLSTQPHA